jgi:putative transposase
MHRPRLVIGEGHLGIWGALANVYPEAGEQRCWNHRILNLLDRVSQQKQAQATVWLREMMYAETREQAVEKKGKSQVCCEGRGLSEAGRFLEED